MDASALTLSGALGFLPVLLKQRYQWNDDFPAMAANLVIADMEKKCMPTYYYDQYPLRLLDKITEYELLAGTRKIRGIYPVYKGEFRPNYSLPVPFREFSNRISLRDQPTVDESDDIDGTVTGASGTAKDRFVDTVELGSSITENSLQSALCVFNDTSLSTTKNLICVSNDPDNSLVTLNGELSELPVAGDTYEIVMNYFMVEIVRKITRATTAGISTIALDIAEEWEAMFKMGLRYYYELQTDSKAPNTGRIGSEYARLLSEYRTEELKKIGQEPRQKPRDIPDIGYHGFSDMNTHEMDY